MDMFKNIKTEDALYILAAAAACVVIAALAIYAPKKKMNWFLNKSSAKAEEELDKKKVAGVMVAAGLAGAVGAYLYCCSKPKSSAMGFRFAMESCGCGN